MNAVLVSFCWLISEVQLMIERLDDLKGTNAFSREIKAAGNLFLKALESYNAKMHKQIGGTDEVERGMHAIATIVEQQQEIRRLINIDNVDQLMIVQAYQAELLEALKNPSEYAINQGASQTQTA